MSYFNPSDYSGSTSAKVQTNLNLSQLILTGPLTSIGISNSSQSINSSADVNLTGTAKFSMATGASDGLVLTSDAIGKGSWASIPNIYNSGTNESTIQGTAKTTTIVNSGSITTNSIISSSLKYPSGTSGQVLTSDSTGLLTLQNIPSPTLTYIQASLTTGNTITGNPNTTTYNIGSITFPSVGTWLLCYNMGFRTSVTATVNGSVVCYVSNISQDPYFYNFLAGITLASGNTIQLGAFQNIVKIQIANTTGNLMMSFKSSGATITAASSPYTYCYALKLSDTI